MKLSTLIRQAQAALEKQGDLDVLVVLPSRNNPNLSVDEWEPESAGWFEAIWNPKLHWFAITLRADDADIYRRARLHGLHALRWKRVPVTMQ